MNMAEKAPSLRERVGNRFVFLSWPLTIFKQSDELRKPDFPLQGEVKRTRFPIMALRYWWVACAIQEEVKRLGRSPVIADVGCGKGILKRFTPPIEGVHWIGLDVNVNREVLVLANYDELHLCDLDVGIPLSESTTDIVVCLHVLEHLPRPEFTIRELARILRPGGLMLLGHPVVPRWVAYLCEYRFSRQCKTGKRKQGRHIHAFWPNRSLRLAEQAGLHVEFMIGSHLLRKTGSPLENYSFWIRMNQLWGALFPCLSQELCIQLRTASSSSEG